MEKTILLDLLREIEATYQADGIGKARVRMANDMGVPQPYISKWLGTKNIRPQTPDAKYAVKIYALYEQVTGKTPAVHLTTKDSDPYIQRVITLMEGMDDEQKRQVTQTVEAFVIVHERQKATVS
ncbi:hypothetical protein GR212_15805 [Rhizobium lusitanum]|uniref:Uncharacterized protein n=1 Tax=Rhizobium lusitanum TaxID=293958 RepID=A0A6L9U6X2_9HYPH|nr:hypothetical protein [Rhizobium lusitanum]NEI71044.1 hypothetical protein [Rhizobium lusitanum]